MNRAVFGSLSILCLLSVSSITGFIQVVKADGGSVYIRADGSVDPPAPISTIDNVTYTLTGNVSLSGDFYPLSDGIVIERDDIVLNGAGYTVHGTGRIWPASGISLTGRSNVTIKNVNIYCFGKGIYLVNSSKNILTGNNVSVRDYGIDLEDGSNNNTVSGNTPTGNVGAGIELGSSSYNTVSGNTVTANRHCGIGLVSSSNNTVSGNDATANWDNGISLSYSSNNTVNGNNVTASALGFGISLWFSSYNTVSGNDASATSLDGIFLGSSSNNNIVSGNNVTANGRYGMFIEDASNHNVVSGNNASANGNDGIYLFKSSYNVVSGNNASANGNDGIHLYISYNNTVSGNDASANAIGIDLEDGSSNNTVSGNTATANGFAVRFHLWSPSNNTIYHNNFIGNAFQVSSDGSPNMWDNGYSSGGNYWSDYNGTDANHDGVGDTPYIIDANNIDNYPLMGMFYSFNVSWVDSGYIVDLISNSTISGFDVGILSLEDPYARFIIFNVTGENDTVGFCRILIPTALMDGTYRILVNGTEVPSNLLQCSNSTHSYLYFNYTHSTQEVIIIPEFPSFLILPPFFMATLLAVIAYKRKHV